MPRFKSNNFYQNRPKIKLFLQKKAKFLRPGGFAPNGLWQLGTKPLDPQISLRHCEFLVTRLVGSKKLKQSACINKQLKKEFCKCRCFAPGLPNYNQAKIGAYSADTIKINYFSSAGNPSSDPK